MYTISTKSLVKSYGDWLQEIPWDYFSTITYKWDITSKRNYTIMQQLESYLSKKISCFQLFWVMEQTSPGQHTHNHLLVQNPIVINYVNQFLQNHNLVDKRFVKHLPYDKKS